MAIISAPDGSYYSNKTGKTYTREQILAKVEEKKSKDSGSLFDSLFSGNTTTYEQTGALENAIQGNGRGVDVGEVESSYNAHSYVETDADRAARLREASNIIGLDEVEGANLMRGGLSDDDVMKSALALAKKKQSEPDDWEQFAADHPATVKYLEQQKNMSISYDDIKPLGKLEETANQVKTHLEMMELEEKIADLGRKYDSANISYNELSADQRVELNDLLTRRKELQGNIDPWSVGNVLGGLLTMKEDLPMALTVAIPTALSFAGVGALGAGVGAIPAAISGFGLGFRVGMGTSMGYRMAGTQYAENMMRADANGQYMDANSLRIGARTAGLGMTLLGSVGVGRLTNKLPMGQVYDKFLRTTSPSVLNNPAARETAWKGYLSTLGVGLKEAAIQDVIFGGGTSALTYGSNRYSEALSGLDYSNREDGTLVENILNGMQQFAPMALGTGVGFSVGGRMMSNAMGKKGNTAPMPVADGLNKTMDALNETKTAQRSPQASREMVNTVFGENASAQDVEINARGLVRLCQEADPENPNLVAEVAQKLGVDAETLNKAVETDDTVRVSVTDFVTEMKDSELRQEMLKEVKDIDGVTENERGEILTHQQQVFEQNMEFIKKAANAEYDHNEPAWVAAYEATQKAYPKLKPKDLEQLTNITYAGFKQMEERGILQLNGFENAEQAIRALDVRRVDTPRDRANATSQDLEQQAASDVAKETTQALFQKAETTKENTASVASDDEYFAAVQKVQNAASEAERGEAQQQLADMVEKAAAEAGFENAIPEQTVAYKVRTKAAPKKTLKVYKVFTVANDGSPTALFIGGTEKLPQGVWLDGIDSYHFKSTNGKYYVPSTVNPYSFNLKKKKKSGGYENAGTTGMSKPIPNEEVRQELIARGFLPKGSKAKSVTALAYRPGWHAGTMPFFPQGGAAPNPGEKIPHDMYHRYNQVVFECELAADKDYTKEAESQPKAYTKAGKFNSKEADLQYMPTDGYYYYATNPKTHGHPELGMWAISGSLKINRALTEEECNKILRENNIEPQLWENGPLDLEKLGYTGQQYDAARKTLAPITYDDDGNVIPLSKRFNPDINDVRYQKQGEEGEKLAAIFPNAKYNEKGDIVPAEQGRAIIELYKNANPSSLAHEMLHHWVFLHENAYRTGKMEGQVLQDFQKLAEFAGHELGTEWSDAEHEKLASAWETYLSEGKAPSLQLVSTFERFKNWMKRIYQTLVRHSIPINDDVRGVFDRMLASDKELEMAQAFYESEPLFAGREMGAAELREYAALVNASHKEAQREMDKRVMAEVNPAMKEIRDNVEANLREDIAGKMMMEPVYAARALFTAPLESADFKAAKETAIKNKIEERLDLLVKQSALGVEKKGMIAEDAKQVSQEWFGGFSNNYDWYKEMFKRRGGKIPASWYRFIQAYKAGEKTLKQMPKTMRAEYEYIANEQLTHGHKESVLGDIPEDIEFVNLKEDNPAMSWIVQNGGGIRLDRQSVYERFGKGALPERWLTDKNGYTIDEVADYVYDGQGSGDRLFQDLTTKPTFAKELNNRVRAGMAQFKEQEYGSLRESATKAVHNAKSLEALGVEMEILASKQEEFKAKQQQKTADAIAEGREKSKWENKIEAEKQKGKEAVDEQRLVDDMHFGRKLREQKQETADKLAEQRLADAIHYGGKLAGQKRESAEKLAEQRQKSADKLAAQKSADREKLENQKLADEMHFGRKTEEAKRRAAREQRRLDVAVSRGKLRAKAAREMAKAQLESTRVGEVLKWQKYAALGKKAGDEAVRLLAKGDYEGALEAKDRQIMCHALALEAGKMDTEINRTMKYFDRINKRGNKMKGIPHEFNVQIDKILSNYGLLSREPLKPLEGDKSLQTFIAECQEDYFTPQVADYLINGQPQHYSWLTVGELRDLKSSVESIRHVGKQMDALVANEKKQRISDIAASMVEQLSTHEKKYALEGEMGAYDKTPLSVTSLVKAETLLRLMDKGEENGVFVQNIYNPIKLGLDDMANRSRKIIADVDKLLADTGWTKAELAKLKDQEHTFDFMPNPKITHEQVLHAALNWGNEGNRDRLRYYFMSPAERKKGSWTPEETAALDAKVMQMFEVLTEKDLKLVQGIWDYLETYAPEIRKHEIDCAGVDPKMVEPTAFSVMTSDGKVVNLKGGYYPIRYDNKKSVRAMDLKEANNLFKNNSAVAASVAHGHTKERTSHLNRQLLLDWSTFTDHLRNVNYDLAMRKPIMDVSRLLRRDDVQSAIAETFGNDNLRMLQTWVRDVATDQREVMTFPEKVMRWTRTRMSVAFLGFRTKALLIDLPQNFITSAWQHGVDEVIKGTAQFYLTGDYREKINFVNQRSPMMRDKTSFMDANLADLRTDLMDGSRMAKFARTSQKLAFCCDMFSDAAVNYPMWIRFHERAMARGLSDAEASLEADAKVRRQSVDTSKAGMAAVQRGSETTKLLTPFYSYFSAYFNRLYYDFNMAQIKWGDGQQMDAAGLMVRTAVLGVGIPTMIEAIMQGIVLNNDKTKDKKKREENMYKEIASSSFSYLANTIPFVGSAATFAFNDTIGKKYSSFELSPIEGAIENLLGVGRPMVNYVLSKENDKDAGKKLTEAVAKAAAVGTPYPNMLNTLALNIWDVMTQSGDFTLADLVTRRRNQK